MIVNVAVVGLGKSGKEELVQEVQQKERYSGEDFSIYSIKHRDTLVYLLDSPEELDDMKERIANAQQSDAVLLTVSASKGIGKRFGEYVLLLDLIGLKKGIVAITRSESVTSDQIKSLKRKVRGALSDTGLEGASIVSTSTVSGEGIAELREKLSELQSIESDSEGDPIFTIDYAEKEKSKVTKVNGVQWSGTISNHDKVKLMPWGKEFIVQSVKVENEEKESVKPRERAFLKFKGFDPWDVHRGDVITEADDYSKTKNLTVDFEISNFFKDTLSKGSEVKLNLGLQYYDVEIKEISKNGEKVDEIESGEEATLQLKSKKIPFAAKEGQDAIIVNPEAHWRSIRVCGGGTVSEIN